MNSRLLKPLLLLLLLGLFFLLGGFERPHLDSWIGARAKNRVTIMWECSIALYLVGAYTALWGRQSVGTLHPISLRSLYIAVGIIAMIGGLLWMMSLRTMNSRVNPGPNQSIQRTSASRPAQLRFNPQRPVADVVDSEGVPA